MPATPTSGSGSVNSKASRDRDPNAVDARHPLLFASEDPDVAEQFEEFKRAGGVSNVVVQRDLNDRIRYNRWKGRTSDYRKHRKALGKDPVPWEGAWDSRVHLADSIIEDLTDVVCSGFERAKLKAKPTDAQDIAKAATVDKVSGKYRDRMRPELKNEAEFLSQFGKTQGAAIVQVGWDFELAMKNAPVTMEELTAAAAQAHELLQQMPAQELGPEVAEKMQNLIILPELIRDPVMEEPAMDAIQGFAREIAAQLLVQSREEYGDEFLENYRLSRTKAREAVRELRKEGKCTLPVPYIARNQPFAVAREIGYDYFCPPEMTDPQASPWHVVRDWLTPEAVYAYRITDGWDADWCDEAIKTAGQSSLWAEDGIETRSESLEDDEVDAYAWASADSKNRLVEVVWFFKRYITEEGVPEIWCTIWSPHVMTDPNDASRPLYAKHYRDESLPGKYPFAGYRWQQKRRQFTNTMGIPQQVGSDQWAIKTSLDMLMDLEQQTVLPERLVDSRLGLKFKVGPGAQITRKRATDIETIQPPTGHPELAFKLAEQAMKRVSNYYGLMNEHVLPAKWQSKLGRTVEKYLGTWAEAWGMIFQLIQRNVTPLELQRIGGDEANFPKTPEEIAGSFDFDLFFDVKDLDMEFVWKKLDAVLKMAVPADKVGRIDFTALVDLILKSIDPTFGTALVQDAGVASQALFSEVRNQVALMYQGNAPDFVENDPTAQAKLKFTQDVIAANPVYQKGLDPQAVEEFKPVFAARMQQWQENLQQSLKQEKNKTIGRLGVDPELAQVEMGAEMGS